MRFRRTLSLFGMSIARRIGWLTLVAGLFVTGAAAAADEPVSAEALRHFKAGVALLQDPDGARYEDAYREFKAAYATSPSPKILGNIGYCALKLERDGEAIAAYTRYLREVPDVDPAEAAQIARDVDTLRAGLVHLALTVEGIGAIVTDKRIPVRGEPITNLYGPVNGSIELGLRPGHHVIQVKVGTDVLETWEFDAQPAANLSRTVARKSAAEASHKRSQVMPWIVTGVGGATLAAGGVFGLVTLGKVSTIESHCPNNQCPPSYALGPAQDDVRHFVRVTDTLLIGGGVIAATGVGLLIWSSSGGSESPRPSPGAAPAGAQSRLTCTPSGCVAAVSGSF